jgi:hypothetical protein
MNEICYIPFLGSIVVCYSHLIFFVVLVFSPFVVLGFELNALLLGKHSTLRVPFAALHSILNCCLVTHCTPETSYYAQLISIQIFYNHLNWVSTEISWFLIIE